MKIHISLIHEDQDADDATFTILGIDGEIHVLNFVQGAAVVAVYADGQPSEPPAPVAPEPPAPVE